MVSARCCVGGACECTNPENYSSGSTTNSRVSHAGEIKRLATRPREALGEGNSYADSYDAAIIVISSDLKHRANDAHDGS